jgi:hypothetical protein
MKVISFKVNDDVYQSLKKKNVSFRAIFEPIAIQLSQNNRRGKQYTDGIRNNSSEVYISLVNIQKTVDKMMELYGFDKKEM